MLSNWELILRLFLAAFLGSIIGLERERLLWAAGLRTHMLVCVGSCLVMIISAFGFFDVLDASKNIALDPSRIAAQVVSGIGFLGAGSILLRNNIVHGLTTAASIWTVAGIGLAVGGGLYLAAIATTILILVILVVVKPLEEKYKAKRLRCTLQFQITHGEISMELLKQTTGELSNYIQQFIVEPSETPNYDNVTLVLAKIHRDTALEMIELIRKIPGVQNYDISAVFSQIWPLKEL